MKKIMRRITIIVALFLVVFIPVYFLSCTNPLQDIIRADMVEAAKINEGFQPPMAPSELSAFAVGNTTIELIWIDNSNNETGFILQRKKNNGGYELVSDIAANSNGCTDSDLEYDTEYSYRLLAYNESGNSAWTPELLCRTNESTVSAPNAPSDLVATVQSQVQIDLNWSINSSEEDGFVLERKELGGTYATIAQIPSGTSSYQDMTLYSDTTYYYRVAERNSTVLSNWSNEMNATTAELETPTGTNSLINNSDKITINWEDNCVFESGYKVQRKIDDEDWNSIVTLPENTQMSIDDNLIGNKEYSYRIRAYDGGGSAQWSEIAISITPRFYIERLDEEIVPEFNYRFKSSIVVRSTGEVYIIYADSMSDKTIHAYGSGRNWTRNELFDYYDYSYSMSLNSQNQPCLMYPSYDGLSYSVFNGSTWETQTIDSPYVISSFDIVHDEEGNIHVAYIGGDYATDSCFIIYTNRNSDGQWTTPKVLYSDSDQSYSAYSFLNIGIDVNDNGNIYIGFVDETSEPTLCRYLQWDETEWILNDLPFIDSTSRHDMCVVENKLYFCYQTTNSGFMLGYPGYSSMISIEIDDNYYYCTKMSEGADGRWHVLYYHYDSSNYSDVVGTVRYVQQTGSSWFTNAHYTADESIGWNWIGHQESLSMAIDGNNKAHFVYFDSEKGLCYGFDNS